LPRLLRAKQVRRPEAVNRHGRRFSGNPGPETPKHDVEGAEGDSRRPLKNTFRQKI
jgi:hypothetical protein